MNDDIFVAYKNPHPLKKNILFRIKADDITKLKDIFIGTSSKLIEMIEKLRKEILLKFEKKKNYKKKNTFKVKKPVSDDTDLEVLLYQ